MKPRRPGSRQLDLLRSMQHGDVGCPADITTGQIWWVGYDVTKRVRALEKAGWCSPITEGDRVRWVLTDAGRNEVEAVDGVPECVHDRARADDIECSECGADLSALDDAEEQM